MRHVRALERARSFSTPRCLFTVLLLLVLAPATPAARAQDAPGARVQDAGEGLVHVGDVGTGVLLLRTDTPGLYIPAPAVQTDVETWVSGIVARTKVTQRFRNPAEAWVDGRYVFPLPRNSAVDRLRMQIGDRFIEGEIKERAEARRVYEAARAQGKKASLVEEERPNVFTNSVANIGPHETVIVQIEYQEVLPLKDGAFSMRLPLVVAPRYAPGPTVRLSDRGDGRRTVAVTDPVPDAARLASPVVRPELGKLNPVRITVHLNAGFPLGAVSSPSHPVTVAPGAAGGVLVTLPDGETVADRDFVLTYVPAAGPESHAALMQEVVDGEHYFLALVVPPKGAAVRRPPPREMVLVIDNSGSMGGESIRQARASLLLALERLRPQDRFNVIRFDDSLTVLFPVPVDATVRNVARAKAYVAGLEGHGGTEMLPAVKAALADATPDDRTHLRQIVLLTDGAVGNEAQIFSTIAERLGRSRLFTVGIGSAPNGYFMAGAARMGRGTYTFIGKPEEVKARMALLFEKLERPVMTGLTASWPDTAAVEAWPDPLPDLYASEPVLLTARAHGASGALVLSGSVGDQPWHATLELGEAGVGPGIARIWARSKIAALEEKRVYGGDRSAIDATVLRTALAHHLVSRLTSLVAVDVTPSRPRGTPVHDVSVPLNLPAGWDFDKVFGQRVPAAGGEGALPAALRARLAARTTMASAVAPGDAGLVLPRGATDMRLFLAAGLGLLLAGSLVLAIGRGRLRP